MKKFFLMLAVAAFSAQTMSAQTVLESKNADNWYIGIYGGVDAPAKGYKVLKNINPEAGLRIGRWFTPVVGLAAEGTARLGDKPGEFSKTFVKSTNISLLGTLNFSNWFGKYPGEPRSFEVIGVAGMGWEHLFGCDKAPNASGEKNALTSKFGVDFTFNLGAEKAWQLYIEPNIVYALNRNDHNRVKYDINDAIIGVQVGLNYKFLNSNGTHNFKIAELRDQAEIDGLNAKINELRSDINAKDGKIAADAQTIADLRAKLAECESRPVQVVEEKENILQPVVIFRQGKSVIDPAQYASIEMIAKYMRNHPEAKVICRGYASTEGPVDLNNKLSVDRANVVKNALIKKYKIAADRITTEGLGATDKISEERDFNRVTMFIDSTK